MPGRPTPLSALPVGADLWLLGQRARWSTQVYRDAGWGPWFTPPAVARALVAAVDVEDPKAVAALDDVKGVFPGVPTCAVRLARRARAANGPASRSHWLASDVPRVALAPDLPTIAQMATAKADFRDAYYLPADHVQERAADDGHRTSPWP